MAYMAFSRLFIGARISSGGRVGRSSSRLKPLILCDMGSARWHFVRSIAMEAHRFFYVMAARKKIYA
jgi:hypothetical protein